jgi:hypothetical protein
MHPYNPTEYYRQTASAQGVYTPRSWVKMAGKRTQSLDNKNGTSSS